MEMYTYGNLLYCLQNEPKYVAQLALRLSNAEIDGLQLSL